MEKIIEGMGKIEFGRFYNNENKIISSLDESPIIDSKKIQTISSVQLKELLDNDYIFNLISHRNKIIVYSTNPINLLSKYRFDIFVKYYYVKSYIENYGCDWIFKSTEIKEKIKNTMINKYGVEHPLQYEEFNEKCQNTKRKNHTWSTSKPEEELYLYIKEKFPLVKRQYKDKIRYQYHLNVRSAI